MSFEIDFKKESFRKDGMVSRRLFIDSEVRDKCAT